jgi:hypothetical protein
MTDTIIKYALDNKTNKLVFIDHASRQLHQCLRCECDLVTVKGEARKKEWHFRHKVDSDCLGGQETVIHKLAKQIIVDNSQILIPDENLFYSKARQEERLNSIIPDVTVFSNGQNIYFEILVTHRVDSLKETFYKVGQYKSIEIDLSNISYHTSPEELEELVLKTAKRRKIFWTAAVEEIETIEDRKHNFDTYQINRDKEYWWTNLNPLAIIGIVLIGIYLLLQIPKLLTNKNRS